MLAHASKSVICTPGFVLTILLGSLPIACMITSSLRVLPWLLLLRQLGQPSSSSHLQYHRTLLLYHTAPHTHTGPPTSLTPLNSLPHLITILSLTSPALKSASRRLCISPAGTKPCCVLPPSSAPSCSLSHREGAWCGLSLPLLALLA